MTRSAFIAAVIAPISGCSSPPPPARQQDSENGYPDFDAELAVSPTTRPHVRPGCSGSGGSLTTRPLSYGSTSMGSPDHSPLQSSPERRRSRDSITLLNRVPEDGAMEFDQDSLTPRYVEATVDDSDSEEEEWELDEELAEQGLYRGSYRRLLALYTLTPITTGIFFVLLALLPSFAYPTDRNSPVSPYPYAPYLPFPFPELLTSIALWSLTYLLRDPLYTFATFISSPFGSLALHFTTITSTILQTVTFIFLRQAAIPLLLIPHYMLYDHPTWEDAAFQRVWWVALGWAAVEAMVGIKQGYEGIALYRGVLVSVRKHEDLPKLLNTQNKSDTELTPTATRPRAISVGDSPHATRNRTPSGVDQSSRQSSTEVPAYVREDSYAEPTIAEGERQPLLPQRPVLKSRESALKDALELEVERDLDQLIAMKNREELEEVYGIPIISIPVFISCLHRINGILSSLGVTLLLTAAYIRSTLSSFPVPPPLLLSSSGSPTSWISTYISSFQQQHLPTTSKSNTHLAITLPVVLVLQIFLASLHTPLILPRIGVHTFVYMSLLLSLGMFFAGLSVWEALS